MILFSMLETYSLIKKTILLPSATRHIPSSISTNRTTSYVLEINNDKECGKTPDLFTYASGQKVTFLEDWYKRRDRLIRACAEMEYDDLLPIYGRLEIAPYSDCHSC